MAGPDPAVAAARRAVADSLADLPPGARVLVACSGGPDSLALAAATAFTAPRRGWQAGAVIVDHGLRPGSAEAAGRAAATCRELGLEPVSLRRVLGARPGTGMAERGAAVPGRAGHPRPADALPRSDGPEGDARAARYAALEDAAEEAGAAAVLLGHTLDDQAETVLLGLARGSGARSIAGMRPVRGLWRRPFLGLRRAQTERVCQALGLEPDRDATNAADGPWRAADGSPLRRAAVRDTVLPALAEALGPGVPEALARTAAQLTRDADLLDAQAAELLDRAVVCAPRTAPGPPARPRPAESAPPLSAESAESPALSGRFRTLGAEGLELDVTVLVEAHPALRTRALRAAAVRAGAAAGSLAAVHVDALDGLVVAFHGQGPIPLPGGVRVRRRCGRLTFGAG